MANQEMVQPEIRNKALEILRSDADVPDKWRKVEALLGHEGPIGLRQIEVATRLGITVPQLKYLLRRNDFREQENRLRAARRAVQREAAALSGSIVTSKALGFTIWLPTKWRVLDDNGDYEEEENWATVEAQLRKARTEYYSYEELNRRYKILRKELEDDIISFEEYCEQERHEEEWSEESFDKELALRRKLRRCSGYWLTQPEHENIAVEVSKFELREPMSSEELYLLQKPGQKNLQWGTRPHRHFSVDGMDAVRFYCIWTWTGVGWNEHQFSTYMAEGLTGWVIDCWSEVMKKDDLKPLFERIISSFKR
jgi:hypothetical protein